MSFCPSDDQLERLLEGKLEDDALAVVVMHLETCAECRGVLEELTRDHLALARWRPALEVTAGCDDSEVFETTEYLTDPGAPAVRPSSRSHPDARRSRAARRSEPAGRLPGGEGDDEDWPVLEGYEILAKLGQGGMGVVYKARQRRLDRLVALKMIRAGDQERPEHRARFRLEAEAAARLRHAQIVQVYDIGECDGRLFCALELLEGGSLETRIAGMPQPERAAAKLLATLAAAIHAAHRAGIVHRDLKSSNVLFTTDGTPKITDFGLAKRLDEEEGHTQTGQVIGSPSFMAPEQARGHNREVGPAADIYALGAILYEMLTGRPPFRGATPMETMIQVVHEDPVPPSRLRPRLSRDLETICLKCLQKEPARRYPTAQALADDLRRYLDGQPILARPISIRERAWKWARREPAQAALVALGLVAVIITVAAGVRLQQERKREERRLADLRDEGRDALSEARAAWREQDWITGHTALARLLAKVEKEPRLTALKNEALRLRAQIQRASADEQQRQLARERYREFVRLREEALYYDTRFSGLDPAGNLAATREAARKALAVFDGGTAPPEALSRAERADLQEGCYELLLVLARAVAQPRPGEDRQKQAAAALRLLDRAAALRTPERAYHLYRADCLAGAGDEPAAARERRAAARRQPTSAFDHLLAGEERLRKRDWAEAIRHLDAAVRLQPDRFWAHALLAVAYLQTQRPAEARAHLTTCLQSRPDRAWLYLLRGFAYGEEGYHRAQQAERLPGRAEGLQAEATAHYEAAEADYRQALGLGLNEEERYILLANRGLLRFRRRQSEAAEADLEAAIQLRPRLVMAHASLAQVYLQQGKADEAIAAFDRAIACRPDLAALYRGRALARMAGGDADPFRFSLALRDLDEALRLAPSDGPEAAGDHLKRAQLLARTQRADAALVSCDAALKANPDLGTAHRLRIRMLLELRRYEDVIDSCDAYLAHHQPMAEILALRGLARASREDLAGAIEDYTRALALQPRSATLRTQRGWAYVLSGAPALAERDFDVALQLDRENADAYAGRGHARALLGRHREAVADAEEALHLGEPSHRTLYNAARVYAQAAAAATAEAARRGPTLLRAAQDDQDRAQALLGQALDRLPASRRATFWREVVQADPALRALRRRPEFARLAARAAHASD